MGDDGITITVMTVDDQETFLRAMASLVEAAPCFEHVGEATSGPEALQLAAALHPDLVLLDVRMPGMDGIETARRLHEMESGAAVVLVSIDEQPALATAAPDAGAVAYVRKQELTTRRLHELWASIISH